MKSLAIPVLLILVAAIIGSYVLPEAGAGAGRFGTAVTAGTPTTEALPQAIVADRNARQSEAGNQLNIFEPKQILFGDLHVHSRTQQNADESTAPLIEDPWKTLPCPADGEGCEVVFSDPEIFRASSRELSREPSREPRGTAYYVRAIETASPVIAADPLGCNAKPGDVLQDGQYAPCDTPDPCFERPDSDECTSPSAQRAWSSAIFLDFAS